MPIFNVSKCCGTSDPSQGRKYYKCKRRHVQRHLKASRNCPISYLSDIYISWLPWKSWYNWSKIYTQKIIIFIIIISTLVVVVVVVVIVVPAVVLPRYIVSLFWNLWNQLYLNTFKFLSWLMLMPYMVLL